jgi:hypothetical protein
LVEDDDMEKERRSCMRRMEAKEQQRRMRTRSSKMLLRTVLRGNR